MPAAYAYPSSLVITDTAYTPAVSAVGQFYDTQNGTVQAIYDTNGSPIANVTTNAQGFFAAFRADIPRGYLKFGTYYQLALSDVAMDGAGATIAAQAAQVAAQQAATAAANAATAAAAAAAAAQSAVGATWATLSGKPLTFPTTTAGISDATAIGKSILTAADAPAVRTIIGAGTGSGTANVDRVYKTAGAWPARPTTDTTKTILFIGAAPGPTIVTSGTAGMYDGIDLWFAPS